MAPHSKTPKAVALLSFSERERLAFDYANNLAFDEIIELFSVDESKPENQRLAALAALNANGGQDKRAALVWAFYESLGPLKAAWIMKVNTRADLLGKDIPYHEEFQDGYSEWVAICPATHAVDQIKRHTSSWHREYSTFFDGPSGGYQYLADVFTQARFDNPAWNTPGMARAIDWLEQQAVASQDVIGGRKTLLPKAVEKSTEQPSACELLGNPEDPALRAYQSRVALLYVYSNVALPKKSGVGAAYGGWSDEALYNMVRKLSSQATRRARGKKMVADIEAALPYLSDEGKGLAQRDINKINNRLGIDCENSER